MLISNKPNLCAYCNLKYICNLDNVAEDYIPSQIHTQSVKNRKTRTTNTHKSNLRTSKKELAKNKKKCYQKANETSIWN